MRAGSPISRTSTELDLLARQLADVDHLGAAKFVLDLGDPALNEALPLAGRLVFGVFRQVAVAARFLDRPDDLEGG